MKKSLFLVALVLGSVLVGCKQEKEVATDVVITINPAELTLSPESEGYRLQAIQNPNAGLAITWASSDTSIVTVSSNGVVTPTGRKVGEVTITASNANAKQNGTCKVTVDLYSSYAPNDYGLFGKEFEYIAGTDTTLELSDGLYKCQKALINLGIYDQGIISGASGMSGAGYMIYHPVCVYVIVEGDYKGYYVGSAFEISDQVTAADIQSGKEIYVIPAGKMLDVNAYAAYLMLNEELNEQETDPTQAQLDELNGYYDAAIAGSTLFYLNYETGGSSLDLGFAGNSIMQSSQEDGLHYKINLRWFERVNNYYGLKVNEAGDDLVQPLEMVYEDRYYEYLGESTDDAEVRSFKNAKLHSPKEIRPLSQLPARIQSLVEFRANK